MSRDDALELWAYRHEYKRLRDKYERQEFMTRDECELLGELTTKLDAWLASVVPMRASKIDDPDEDQKSDLSPQLQKVLNAVRRLGVASYKGTAQETGLTLPTVSNYVRFLHRKGYVEWVPGNAKLFAAVLREEVHA